MAWLMFIACHMFMTLAQGRPRDDVLAGKAKRYLVEFGYLDSFSDGDNEEALAGSLVNFQYFANLPLTGKLDDASLQQMTIPRCGHADPKIKVPEKTLKKHGLELKISKPRRLKRYVHQGTKWVSKSLLTWRLVGRGRTLDRETIRTVLTTAFEKWSDITNLDFKETSLDNPDIWVKFATYYHDDPYSFDGQGGTLAHAFYPHNEQGLSGDVHFDDSEDFTHESPTGRNLLWVATHEIGHSIGMEHSNIQDAVMYPWYRSYRPGFSLTYDDISGIQALYGSRTPKKTTPSPVTTVKPTSATTTRSTTVITTARPTPRNVPCPANIIVAFYNSYRDIEVLITSDDKIAFMLKGKDLDYGPYERKNYFPYFRIPGPISAGFSSSDIDPKPTNGVNREYTVVFSASKYYFYKSFSFRGGPYSIYGDGENPLGIKFPTTVKRIDAAFVWLRNNRIYFFAGDQYWRYDASRRILETGYPRLIRDAWIGVPTPVDAVVSSKKYDYTYFIKENMLYSLDNFTLKVKPGYPQHVGKEWLNCGGANALKAGGAAGGLVAETSGFELKGAEP